jgi:streptogramin lyase
MTFRFNILLALVAAVACLFLTAGTLHADVFTGTLYYTLFSGGPNVDKVTFTYNSTTHTVSYTNFQAVTNEVGADGIMFAPNGNLIVTSNATNNVYRIDASTGATLQTVSTGTNGFPDYHMALDPSGNEFYSSNRYNRGTGPLDTFKINSNGTFNNATTTPITGGDSNVTQLAFAPNGKILYTDGTPNSNGSIGLFTFGSPDTTTQLKPAGQVPAAHGVVYDPFTGKWTMFGGGAVATMDPNAGSNAAIAASLEQRNGINADFDQGSVDGLGHALIAGNGDITFIDYSQTHDITSPLNTVNITGGFGAIDDVAPLVGLGSQSNAPEPSSMTILGLGALGLLGYARRRQATS